MKRYGLIGTTVAIVTMAGLSAWAELPLAPALPYSATGIEQSRILKAALEAPKGVKVLLKPLVRVEGESILLMQIADFQGEDYVLIDRLAQLNLAASPAIGRPVRLSRSSVQRAIANVASSAGPISVEGAEAVSVERRSMLINMELLREEITKRAKAELPYEQDQLIVSQIQRLPEKIELPRGKLKFEIEFQYGRRMLGQTSFTGIFYVNGRIEKRITGAVEIDMHSAVLQATRMIGRGQTLHASDFRTISWNQSKLPSGAVTVLSEELGPTQAAKNIQTGQILTASMIFRPPLIKRNAPVSLVIQNGKVRVSARGVAKESGGKGEIIRIKSLGSGKEIFARVLDSQTAEVIY